MLFYLGTVLFYTPGRCFLYTIKCLAVLQNITPCCFKYIDVVLLRESRHFVVLRCVVLHFQMFCCFTPIWAFCCVTGIDVGLFYILYQCVVPHTQTLCCFTSPRRYIVLHTEMFNDLSTQTLCFFFFTYLDMCCLTRYVVSHTQNPRYLNTLTLCCLTYLNVVFFFTYLEIFYIPGRSVVLHNQTVCCFTCRLCVVVLGTQKLCVLLTVPYVLYMQMLFCFPYKKLYVVLFTYKKKLCYFTHLDILFFLFDLLSTQTLCCFTYLDMFCLTPIDVLLFHIRTQNPHYLNTQTLCCLLF